MLAKWIILQLMAIHMHNSEFLQHQKVGGSLLCTTPWQKWMLFNQQMKYKKWVQERASFPSFSLSISRRNFLNLHLLRYITEQSCLSGAKNFPEEAMIKGRLLVCWKMGVLWVEKQLLPILCVKGIDRSTKRLFKVTMLEPRRRGRTWNDNQLQWEAEGNCWRHCDQFKDIEVRKYWWPGVHQDTL